MAKLRQLGASKIRAVDIKPLTEWYQYFDDVENISLDLREKSNCMNVTEGVTDVYNLAAEMGGIGYITENKIDCMLSVLINTHLLMAAHELGVKRFFFSSSVCAYNTLKQENTNAPALKESDAYPAMPEDGYGWEKLFSERMCHHYNEAEPSLTVRVARLHNSYGPHSPWYGGREKAPAAICRKIIEAKHSANHKIDIWGDGEQTRSFMYIDDNIEGILKIMDSDIEEPINLGSSHKVTINELVSIIEKIADIKVERNYLLDKPRGVNGRNSDNSMILDKLGWEPSIGLEEGLTKTYQWIEEQYLTNYLGL